jgi:hypothetical protein
VKEQTEFARRLGVAKTNLDRLFDLTHTSRLDQDEAAFRVFGKRLAIEVQNAA